MDIFWLNVLFLPFLCLFQNVSTQEEVLFGKIVAVENPSVKKSLQNQERNEIFATRAVAFLKKDGDLFKIHRPGLLGKKDTISFESVRLPGFFLRQKNKKVHLDNLKSRYITKDATFIESKDAVGETFRLFMHNDQFLCHEQGHGFSVFMLKDTPKRDTLNCAFNIVKMAPKDNIGHSKPEQKKIAQTKETKPKEGAAQQQAAKANKDHTPMNPQASADQSKTGKRVSMYIKDKATGQSIPEFKDLVDAIKQQKDPFPQQQGGSLIVLSGPTNGKAQPPKESKKKAAQTKELHEKKNVPGNMKPIKKANGKDKLAIKLKAFEQKKAKPGGNKINKVQKIKPVEADKKNLKPQPVNDMETASFRMQNKQWFLGYPTKKVFISNPYSQNLQQQQRANAMLLAKNQATSRFQAFAKKQALARQQAMANQQSALKRYQYGSLQYPYNLHPQFQKEENPSGRQVITSLFPQPVANIHATNVVDQSIHYVPPNQWDTVMRTDPSAWSHNAKDLLNNHQTSTTTTTIATAATSAYTTDNLLTKLHPELNLLHTAHHDVNEVISTDPNIHHLGNQQASHYHPTPLHVTTLPHDAVLHAGQISEAISEPVGEIQHVHLPSAVPIHDNDRPVHVGSSAPLIVGIPHPSVVTSNVVAASELVHTHPDITLEEAFHKMEPLPSHPIEIASGPLHHDEPLDHDGLHPDRAFHMRTHYVAGNAVDMNEDDQNTLKEVHVVHHNHHLVHTANEEEKQKFVSTLVDPVSDLCISLMFDNQLGDRYRLVSTLNPHGYRPKGKKFSLKTIFKEPKKRKVMSFKAYDEEDTHRLVLLNGHKELNIYPVSCANDPVQVVVDSVMNKLTIVTGSKKNEVLGQKRQAEPCTQATNGTTVSCCVFPFIYKGERHESCLPFGDGKGRTWCSLTPNFDKERRWGMCSIPDLSVFQASTGEDQDNSNNKCPSTCTNECGNNCPIACCTDSSSSSLLH